MPTRIVNQHGDQSLLPHAVDDFKIVRAPRGPVFMAAYAVQTEHGFSGRYEVAGWFLNLGTPEPRLTACGSAFVDTEAPADLAGAMRDALVGNTDSGACGAS